MKKKIILITGSLAIAALTFSSYSTGYGGGGGNATGAAGSTVGCTPCHGSTTTATMGNITVIDKSTSMPVTKYTAGVTYQVNFTGTNSASLPKFGFQVAVTNSSSASTGTLIATSTSNTAVRTVGAIKIIEHTSSISGVTAGAYNISFDWTAPVAGTGTVTFYGVLNAVNGNGGDDTGDDPSNGTTTVLTENSTSIASLKSSVASKIFPNPCINVLKIELKNEGNFNAQVMDISGRQLLETSNQKAIDVTSLSSGVYFIKITQGNAQQVASFVKQ